MITNRGVFTQAMKSRKSYYAVCKTGPKFKPNELFNTAQSFLYNFFGRPKNGGLIVDEFFSSVPGSNFDMCVIFTQTHQKYVETYLLSMDTTFLGKFLSRNNIAVTISIDT